jgi:hypothetical protein
LAALTPSSTSPSAKAGLTNNGDIVETSDYYPESRFRETLAKLSLIATPESECAFPATKTH